MAAVSIKEQTRHLIGLQAVDTKIHNCGKNLEAIPQEIDAKVKEFEAKKSSLKALDDKSKDLLLKKKDKELELATNEETLTKLQSQLYQLKTNKEYTAMLKEIEGHKADKSLTEDGILNLMVELDDLKAEVEKEKQNLAEEEKKLNADKTRLDEDKKVIEEELLALRAKRDQITPTIEKKTLQTYERILKGKDGLALVKIVDDACQGCFMNVTSQTINEIRMYERFVTCEMCARILYEERD